MNFVNLLSTVSFSSLTVISEEVISAAVKYPLISKIITWLIGLISDVGIGIILFTVALKLITLPLDIYSRASMKKNSLKMEAMQDDLKKLQKQYANNKELYQQKMMALYKKNGYSAFSACLPTIVSLVFFIIVIGAFSSYSRISELKVINEMAKAYNEELVLVLDDDGNKAVGKDEDGELFVYTDSALKNYSEFFELPTERSGNVEEVSLKFSTLENPDNKLFKDFPKIKNYFTFAGEFNYENENLKENLSCVAQDYIIRKVPSELLQTISEDSLISGEKCVKLRPNGYYQFTDKASFIRQVNAWFISGDIQEDLSVYFDENKGIDASAIVFSDGELIAKANMLSEKTVGNFAIESVIEDYKNDVILDKARQSAKDKYDEVKAKSNVFFWVKNIWVADSPFNTAISDFSSFTSRVNGNKNTLITSGYEYTYDEATAYLPEEKEKGFGKGNGYFVLIVLSIASMLLSTLISSKQQKTQMELSTVDGNEGTAAQSQKMMMWIMPITFGIFAFIYSAGFSIYMITSTLLSTISTILINKLVERKFNKKIQEEIDDKFGQARYGKRR